GARWAVVCPRRNNVDDTSSTLLIAGDLHVSGFVSRPTRDETERARTADLAHIADTQTRAEDAPITRVGARSGIPRCRSGTLAVASHHRSTTAIAAPTELPRCSADLEPPCRLVDGPLGAAAHGDVHEMELRRSSPPPTE